MRTATLAACIAIALGACAGPDAPPRSSPPQASPASAAPQASASASRQTSPPSAAPQATPSASPQASPPSAAPPSPPSAAPPSPPSAAPPAPQPRPSWRVAYDLDGDGTNDRIVSEFTGGGHCCYRIGAALSSTGVSTVFPFEMDGGYPAGLDLSQPSRFTIRTRDGSLPEIVYEIATYNGEPEPIDPAITKRWGIRSHRVALCFAGGKPRASDDRPDLPPCKR